MLKPVKDARRQNQTDRGNVIFAGQTNETDNQAVGGIHHLIKPSPTYALPMWFAVIGVVLITLWLETTQHPLSSENFLIEGSPKLIGAKVKVDGNDCGELIDSKLESAVLHLHLNDGKHLVEISQPGFQSFHKEIDLTGEDYLWVKLNP